MLRAGVATANITPERGLELGGYPHFPRHNTGFHDPLFASCLYLENGGGELAVVTLDLLFFSKKYVRAARALAKEQCGIAESRVAICCSHTHSGPWAAGKLDMEALTQDQDGVDKAYVEKLTRTVAELVARAKREAFPAELGTGKAVCGASRGVGGNRRDKNGVHDADAGVVCVRNLAGEVRGVIANYTLHPTFIHEDCSLVSADYPGYTRIALKEAYPNAVFGFAQGASGDQSSRYFRTGQSFDEAERVGREIGRAVREAIAGMRFDADPKLDAASLEIPLEIRDFPPVEALRARAERATEEYEARKRAGEGYLDVQNANLRMLGAEDLLGFALMREQNRPIALRDDETPAEVMALRLGEACVVCVPGEYFVEYALRIKAESPYKHTMVFALANGCLPGYCVTEQAAREGGYEADTTMLTPAFGRKMTESAIAAARRV